MTVKIEDMFGNAAYEFVDLIKAEPLVSESSPFMDVDKKKFREVQRSEKITQRAKDTSDEATAEVAKRKMSAKAKVQLPNIRKEEKLVDKILAELEEATLHLGENRFASHGGRDTDAGSTYAKPSKGGNMKGVYTLKGKDGKPLFDKRPSDLAKEEIETEAYKPWDFGPKQKAKKKYDELKARKEKEVSSGVKGGNKTATRGNKILSVAKDMKDTLDKNSASTGADRKKQGLQPATRRHTDAAMRRAQSGLPSSSTASKFYREEVETIDERVRLESDNGNLLMVVAAWKGRSYQLTMFFPQPSMPTREEVESEIQKVYPGSRLMSYRITRRGEGQPIMQVVNSHSKNYLLNNGNIGEDWQKVNKSDKTDGMSKKAVAAYRRENPGSKLKTAVTGDPKPGSKDAKRRKSFCARSKGQQDMHNIDCSKTPDKPVCKARRRWKC